MYRIRIKNYFSLCTSAKVYFLEKFLHRYGFYFRKDENDVDLLIFGFSNFDYRALDLVVDSAKSFLKDFCFFCADCGNEIQFEVEKDKNASSIDLLP